MKMYAICRRESNWNTLTDTDKSMRLSTHITDNPLTFQHQSTVSTEANTALLDPTHFDTQKVHELRVSEKTHLDVKYLYTSSPVGSMVHYHSPEPYRVLSAPNPVEQ